MMELGVWVTAAADWVWDIPMVLLLMGGGIYLFVSIKFMPFRHFLHGLQVLTGKYDQEKDAGQVSHYQALSVALASTIGMGNISGVAFAIWIGGPGVIFWMWVSALLGMAIKYYECSLAVMFRGRDSAGEIQGGPMYVIVEGLGARWRPLAVVFSVGGLFVSLPLFTSNQMVTAITDIALPATDAANSMLVNFVVGVVLAVLTAFVIWGGVQRIGRVVSMIVPFMVGLYFFAVSGILIIHYQVVPEYFLLILTDAFDPQHYGADAMFGGGLASLIVYGARRAIFSNEAGMGTAAMAHGAAKTSQPVHEGLVAMIGPVVDTMIVCTLTAMAILVTGVWQSTNKNGIDLVASAFTKTYPEFGGVLLLICVISFGFSSLFSLSYYGSKCFSFLFGADKKRHYQVFYVISVILAAVLSFSVVVSFMDLMIVFMVIPTMLSTLLLSSKVRRETKNYFKIRR